VSAIVTVAEVATTGPEVEPVLSEIVNVSVPSVVASLVIVLTIVPALLVTATDPEVTPSVKSGVPTVPAVVQYKVADPTLVVVTVNVTLYPSFMTYTEGVMA